MSPWAKVTQVTRANVFPRAAGDTTQTQAAACGQGSIKGVSAAAARNLGWLAWAERVAAANAPMGEVAGVDRGAATMDCTAPSAFEDYAVVAEMLAGAVPRVGSMGQLHIELLHAQLPFDAMPVALNGAVVGLSVCSSSGGGGHGTGPTVSSFNAGSGWREVKGVCGHHEQGPCLPECLGLGLVRSIDGPRAELYLLTDLADEQVHRVDLLQMGKLELPDKLLECRACASPHQGLFCLTSAATGAGQIKSRNNLLRSSQLLR